MRELAGWDPDEFERVDGWPLREALLAYEQRLKVRAAEAYDTALTHYYLVAPYSKDAKPPEVPSILRGN